MHDTFTSSPLDSYGFGMQGSYVTPVKEGGSSNARFKETFPNMQELANLPPPLFPAYGSVFGGDSHAASAPTSATASASTANPIEATGTNSKANAASATSGGSSELDFSS